MGLKLMLKVGFLRWAVRSVDFELPLRFEILANFMILLIEIIISMSKN